MRELLFVVFLFRVLPKAFSVLVAKGLILYLLIVNPLVSSFLLSLWFEIWCMPILSQFESSLDGFEK